MDGILNVYKEKGYTSHDVVAKLRGMLGMKKIGHTGTLDPEAEGVLVVCLGKATKLSGMLTDTSKTYRAVMLLGVVTDTQDASGRVISETPVCVTEEEVRKTAASFVGWYEQTPPMYSAKKVQGKKLYELARAGKEVSREPQRVKISEISVEDIALPRVTLTVTCSKGTYIRTLCHDFGQKLGCGALMESLLRLRVGRFGVEESLRLSDIQNLWDAGLLREKLLAPDALFSEYRPLSALARGEGDKLLHNGNPVPEKLITPVLGKEGEAGPEKEESEKPDDGRARLYDSEGNFIGIYRYDAEKKRYQPVRVLL